MFTLLKMRCVILVFLELFLHTSAVPEWFHHHDRIPSNQGSHGSRPASASWGPWGPSWDYNQMTHTQNGYLAYNGGSTDHYSPQAYNPTPRPTKNKPTGVNNAPIGGATTTGNNAIVSLVMDEDRRDVATEQIKPVISDASAASSGEANHSHNRKPTGGNNGIVTSETSLVIGDDRRNMTREMSPVSSGDINQNQNFDQVPQNNQNTDQKSNTSEGTATSLPEEELVFGAAAIGSKPVPTLNDTSAPAFSWHVGIYSKMWAPYMQICGGSLVKKDVVLSAAHCFWTDAEGQQPATQFAVAGGKLFRPWTSKKDQFAQRSDVSQIVLPDRFRGITTSFQDDIAVVRLSTPFVYGEGLGPVCVDFGVNFERQQVLPGIRGTVAGWGLTEENGLPSQRLNFLELPYIDVGHCLFLSEPSFIKYITSDKICAGDQKSGKALCRGDSGGGLVFFSETTPYLRGIASTAAANENLCNAFAIATFTQIYAHRTFLRDNVPDIDKECARTVNGDLVTENGAERNGAESNTGLPINAPLMSRLPYGNFYCNCNCKP